MACEAGQVKILGGRVLDLRYFAVRDPSAVKVKYLSRQPLSDGSRFANLTVDPPRDPPGDPAQMLHCRGADAAFVMTIGLLPAREEGVVKALGEQGDVLGWGDLHDLMCRLKTRYKHD